jgi:hypothetical protein
LQENEFMFPPFSVEGSYSNMARQRTARMKRNGHSTGERSEDREQKAADIPQ